ncbi:MAG TPA: hypothetical protein VKQ71_00955 [Acidimicrobiales bacterium]|nr:hypothetical protein [Acidimicrobiales bacterium]
MFNSAVLDVAIGLVFVYVVFALFNSGITEGIGQVLGWRSSFLLEGIVRLLHGDTDLLHGVLTNPLLTGLSPRRAPGKAATTTGDLPAHTFSPPYDAGPPGLTRRKGPSYIAGELFSRAMLASLFSRYAVHDLPALQARLVELEASGAAGAAAVPTGADAEGGTGPVGAEPAPGAVGQVPAPGDAGTGLSPVERSLLTVLHGPIADTEAAVTRVASWYDAEMDRVSGWYKRFVQRRLLVLALLFVVAFNVDTLGVIDSLWHQGPVRDAVVAAAAAPVVTTPATTPGATGGPAGVPDVGHLNDVARQVERVPRLGVPVGWSTQAWHRLWDGRDTRALGATTGSTPPPASPPATGTLLGRILLKLVGLAISVFAVSRGAPFWFDVLGRLNSLRSSGPKPAPSPTP